IPIARWLIYSDRAVAVAADSQADAREGGWISSESRKVFVSDNGRRYIPRRIERDVLHGLCQQGSRVFPRLTDNDARRPYRLPIIHNGQGVIGDIHHYVGGTQISREPTPTLHIGKDGINPCASNFALTASVLVCTRGDNYIHVPCFSGTGKGCLKLFVLRLLWIKGIQGTSNIMAASNFLQHLLQIGRFEIEVNRAAYSAECDSACAGMSHESRDRIRQRKFIRGQLRWITISKSRCRIILWIKTISSNTMQEVYGFARTRERSGGIHPKRYKIAPSVKALNRSSVLRARHILLEFIRY